MRYQEFMQKMKRTAKEEARKQALAKGGIKVAQGQDAEQASVLIACIIRGIMARK